MHRLLLCLFALACRGSPTLMTVDIAIVIISWHFVHLSILFGALGPITSLFRRVFTLHITAFDTYMLSNIGNQSNINVPPFYRIT